MGSGKCWPLEVIFNGAKVMVDFTAGDKVFDELAAYKGQSKMRWFIWLLSGKVAMMFTFSVKVLLTM